MQLNSVEYKKRTLKITKESPGEGCERVFAGVSSRKYAVTASSLNPSTPLGGIKWMKESAKLEFTEKEKRLIQMIRELGYGEIRIYVTDGQPVRAEEIKKSVKF